MKIEVGMFIDFYHVSKDGIKKYHGKIIEIEKKITPWKDTDDGIRYLKVKVGEYPDRGFNISNEDVIKYYAKEEYPELYI